MQRAVYYMRKVCVCVCVCGCAPSEKRGKNASRTFSEEEALSGRRLCAADIPRCLSFPRSAWNIRTPLLGGENASYSEKDIFPGE